MTYPYGVINLGLCIMAVVLAAMGTADTADPVVSVEKRDVDHTGAIHSTGDNGALWENDDDEVDEDDFDKRSRDRFMFSPTLGKRGMDSFMFAPSLGKRKFDRFAFAPSLGKRPMDGYMFAPGLGKRPIDNLMFAPGLGKRRLDSFMFAPSLGKRRMDNLMFAPGLGKKLDPVMVSARLGRPSGLDPMMFAPALGKRSVAKRSTSSNVEVNAAE